MQIHEYKKIRKFYFTHHQPKDIAKKIRLSKDYIEKIIIQKSLKEKKERYYLFLINYAYRHDIQISEVCALAGLKPNLVNVVKRKYKIKTKRFEVCNKRINEKIKDEIVSMYLKGETASSVAKAFGYKTSKTVYDVLRSKNISSRPRRKTRKLDYNFFKKIDSHDKAYILGLLYTDGYIYRDYLGFCVQLTESDGYLLKTIAEKIGPAATVIKINVDSKRKYMKNSKNMMRLGVYSKELAEQVKRFGVVKRKTYDLKIKLNLIPSKFRYSLLRGIIDGDGTIGIAKTKNIWLKVITKSENFADSICSLVKDGFHKYPYKTAYGDMYSVGLKGGNKNTINFLKKIYEHKNDLYLQRKFDKISFLLT